MDKTIEVIGGGLKCDTAGCGYVDESIQFDDYPKWVGAPCPKCGASLLTEADYLATKFLRSMADYMNVMIPASGNPDEPRERMRFEFDGSGEIKIVDELALTPPPSGQHSLAENQK